MEFRTRSALQFVAGSLALCSFSYIHTATPPGGEQLYRSHCARCHGADGSKGKAGKNKLDASILSPEAIALQIENGKKGMPAFKKKLSAEEISIVSTYILTLRK